MAKKRARKEQDDDAWLAVVGRSLAYLCLHNGDMASEDLATKSSFLTSLGLPLRDAAVMLDSTENSLRELRRRAKKAGRGGRAKRAARAGRAKRAKGGRRAKKGQAGRR